MSPQDAPAVPAVRRAPRVLVGLASAQEMELPRALGSGPPDCVAHEDGARAVVRERWVEAAEIGVGAPVVMEAVIDADNGLPEHERMEPQQLAVDQLRHCLPVKRPEPAVSQESALADAA